MATVTKTFTFDADVEGWATEAVDASVTMTRDTTDGSPGTGCLQARSIGKKISGSGTWFWAGTWEGLGVPAGSTVTAVNGNRNWRCSEYTTGGSAAFVALIASDAAESTSLLLVGARGIAGTTSWATDTSLGDVSVPSGLQSSDTALHLRNGLEPWTGNSSSAAVTLRLDQISVTITYTTGGGTTYTKAGHAVESA